MTDAEGDEPRGAVVFHLDPDLLPENWEEVVRLGVEEEGGEYTGTAEWIVYKMEFVEDDRVGLFMDHDATAVIRGVWATNSLTEAQDDARAWVEGTGEEVFRVPLDSLPNIFQYAFMTAAAGREIELTGAYFLWAPAEIEPDTEWVAVRKFPTDVNQLADEGEWNLMARVGVEELLARRGW